MDTEQIFKITNHLFTQIILGVEDDSEEKIKPLLRALIENLTSSEYDEMSKIRGGLFALGDKYDTTFFLLLYLVFRSKVSNIINISNESILEINKSSFDNEYLTTKLRHIYETSLNECKQFRLSEFEPNINVSPEEASALFAHLTDLFNYTTSKLMLDFSEINSLIIWAGIGRKLSIIINAIDYFYVLLENIIERLTTSQRFQLGRDFAEEVLILSYKDNKRHWGYFIQFKVFNGQFIARETIIYLNACLACTDSLQKISKMFYETFLINVYRFYRNFRFIDAALEFYEFILENTNLSSYQLENITNSHYHLLVTIKDDEVLLSIYNFVNQHRESILDSGEHGVMPWLNLIYIAKRQFNSHPDLNLLEQYLPIFESIVNKDIAKRLRILSQGDSPELKKYFIDSLISHSETRDSDDFAGEIRNTLVIANRLIEYAFQKNDKSAFLLAMLLKADNTYVFKEQEEIKTLREAKDLTYNEAIYEHFLGYENYIRKELNLPSDVEVVWLASTIDNVYKLTFSENEFSEISMLSNYNQKKMNDWISQEFKNLSFDETVMVDGQLHQYFSEYQKRDLEKITNSLSFMNCNLTEKQHHYVIKDMELGRFPHNLLIKSSGDLLHNNSSITNILSLEWYLGNVKKITLRNNYDSSLWIPIKEGDLVLNLLFSKLEKAILDYNINLVTEAIPLEPLCSDINILIAHGDKGISSFPFLFANNSLAITKINKIIAECDILILFVCHSGSFKKSIIRQKINSLVRLLLKNNIKTVIAPFWSLHISIPPIWLPAFMDALNSGNQVSQAVYIANKSVYNQNMNPGAWCCMHAFGNPSVQIVLNNV